MNIHYQILWLRTNADQIITSVINVIKLEIFLYEMILIKQIIELKCI